MNPLLRWLAAAVAGSAAAYLAWLLLGLASQALLGILGESHPAHGRWLVSTVVSHGAGGAAFVLAASRVAPPARRAPAGAVGLLALVLLGLVLSGVLAWPTGRHLTGAAAMVAGAGLAAGVLMRRGGRAA